MLIVLVGARGAGKTTALDSLNGDSVVVLRPSTTRQRRSDTETEYDFVTSWDRDLYAWEIKVSDHYYGMRNSELEKARGEICLTVFDPLTISVFESKRGKFPFESLTIGLDTIDDLPTQHERVVPNLSRRMSAAEFETTREVVKNCDMVLAGGPSTITKALRSVIALVKCRGGVITKEHLRPLIEAGSVLKGAATDNIRSASYDLTIGDQVWCQRTVTQLTDSSPRFEIPPYSYAIVTAAEAARLPPFMIARFDVKVSYFLEGVILSNGPQIDPGYKGALFCMLYNGGGRPKVITRGRHFATIDFTLTTKIADGYQQKYQFQERMERFMTDDAILSPGGTIVKLIDEKVDVVSRELKNIKISFWAIAAVFIVFPSITIPYLWSQYSILQDKLHTLDEQKLETRQLITELQSLKQDLKSSMSNVADPAKAASKPASTPRKPLP